TLLDADSLFWRGETASFRVCLVNSPVAETVIYFQSSDQLTAFVPPGRDQPVAILAGAMGNDLCTETALTGTTANPRQGFGDVRLQVRIAPSLEWQDSAIITFDRDFATATVADTSTPTD